MASVDREQPRGPASSPDVGLVAGYREMANDQDREAEAREWCEGLIGDAALCVLRQSQASTQSTRRIQ